MLRNETALSVDQSTPNLLRATAYGIAPTNRVPDRDLAQLLRKSRDLVGIDAEVGIAYALTAETDGRPQIVIGRVFPAEDWLLGLTTRLMVANSHQLPKVMETLVDDRVFLDADGKFAKYNRASQKAIAQSTRRGIGIGAGKATFELCYFMRPIGCMAVEPLPAASRFDASDWLIWLGERLGTLGKEQLHALASRVSELVPIVEETPEAAA